VSGPIPRAAASAGTTPAGAVAGATSRASGSGGPATASNSAPHGGRLVGARGQERAPLDRDADRPQGATDAAPFAGVRAAPEKTAPEKTAPEKTAPEKTAPWDRRKPYPPADVERLLAAATGEERALVLLGAHAGLRVSEALALRHADVRLSDGELDVRAGKGGKARTVPVSESLASALREVAHTDSQDSREDGHAEGRVPRLRDDRQARLRLRRLTVAAGVPYRGYHALRHYCGTRLMRDTGDLDTVARVLGHSSIETARAYAKWSDQGAKTAIRRW